MLFDGDIKATDLQVYGALDLLAGERGWWYGQQEIIAEAAIDRANSVSESLNPHTIILGLRTVSRSIKKLRDKGYIVTQNMGLQMNNVRKYFIVARKPNLPPRSERD